MIEVLGVVIGFDHGGEPDQVVHDVLMSGVRIDDKHLQGHVLRWHLTISPDEW